MLVLPVEKRERLGTDESAVLRVGGRIPAVVYGKKVANTPFSVDAKMFEKVYAEAGESHVISLTGLDGEINALVYGIDRDPVHSSVRHIDFYAVEKGQKVEVEVPVEFVGISPAVKELGGTLVKVVHEIGIEAEPQNIPEMLEADISKLVDFDARILASDLKLPAGVELTVPPEEIIALVAEVTEEEEVDTGAPDLSSIEVEKKGKSEEEDSDKQET